MARWHYDPTSPETIFASFMDLEPGYSDWDEAEANIFGMVWTQLIEGAGE